MVVCSLGWLFGLAGPGPRQRAPSREGEKGKGRQRGRQKQQREAGDSRKEARGKCNRRALRIYKGPRSRQGAPGRGSRERMEPDGWLSVVWVGFWACGPRSPPEGPKQRRREGKRKATGTPEAAEREPGDSRKEARGKCNRRALHIYKGPRSRQGAPGRGSRERMEPDGWLSLVWVGFLGLRAPVPARGPQAEKERREKEGNGDARSSRESQEIQGRGDSRKEARGKCNRRALRIYKGPRSRQGAPGRGSRERMEPDGWLSVVWVGFWACGPRSPPEGPKQRRREGKRKATGTPEAAERARRFKEGSPGEVQQTGVAYI